MKILDAKIDWMLEWANDPGLKILVDNVPDYSDVVHQSLLVKNGILYYAEKGGYVHYFVSTSGKGGYGGHVFTIKVDSCVKPIQKVARAYSNILTYKTIDVVGPWSGHSGTVNKLTNIQCLEVSMTAERKVFDRGHTFISGNITLDLGKDAINIINPKLVFTKKDEFYVIDKKQKDELGM